MANISVSGRELPVGLDIGNNQIRAVQLKSSQDTLELHQFGAIDIRDAATHEGEIVDPPAISDALKTLWKSHRFTGKTVAAGISNQQTVYRLVEFPWTEEKDLEDAVKMQAQEFIPIPIEDAVLDFAIVGEKLNTANERVYELMLAAVQKSSIDNLVEAIQGAGLRLVRVDLTPLAIVRSALGDILNLGFGDLSSNKFEAIGVLHLSSSTTNLAVVERGAVRFMRFLPQGADAFKNAIMNELGTDEVDAWNIIREIGLPALDGTMPSSDHYAPETVFTAQSVLEREANKFISELRLSLEYYLSQGSNSSPVTKIHCTGSGLQLRHFADYLHETLHVEIIRSDPFNSINMSAALQDSLGEDRYSYSPAIGLAIGGR